MVDDDIPRLEANKDDPADLYLSGDTNTFTLIIYDRLSLESAISDGSFTAVGNVALVGDFDRWLAAN